MVRIFFFFNFCVLFSLFLSLLRVVNANANIEKQLDCLLSNIIFKTEKKRNQTNGILIKKHLIAKKKKIQQHTQKIKTKLYSVAMFRVNNTKAKSKIPFLARELKSSSQLSYLCKFMHRIQLSIQLDSIICHCLFSYGRLVCDYNTYTHIITYSSERDRERNIYLTTELFIIWNTKRFV